MKLSIIIPAHNEENRIERTIRAYFSFFSQKKQESDLNFELIIVLNGCTDNTIGVVERLQQELNSDAIIIIDLKEAGKGLAIHKGFENALTRDNDLIGFVDADMATLPQYFYALVCALDNHYDGAIASRYMPGAQIFPPRPFYKRWGSRLIFEPYIWLLFRLSYYDYQCGAKLFKRTVIKKIIPYVTVTQWAIDVELLYLCKKFGFKIIEIITVWTDQAESKLTIRGGMKMFRALFDVYKRHR